MRPQSYGIAMLQTYEAVLRSNQIEWQADEPRPIPPGRALRVHITVLDDANQPVPSEQGLRMAEALEKLAAQNAVSAIGDPATWQREQREDRILPGRE